MRPRYTSFRDAGLDEALERGARLLGEAAAGVDVAVWTKDFDQLVFDVLDGRVSVDAMYETATTCRAIERTLRAQLIGRLAGHGFETVASQWREDAEAERRATGGGAMSADDVVDFVDRYYPSYEAYLPELYRASPCAEDRTKRVWIGRDRLPSPAPPAGHDVLQ